MIGFLYLSWSLISHIGYTIKEKIHDIKAPIDMRTNTYYGFDGRLKDATSKQYRRWEIDNNGDEVLKDSATHVIRNLSQEKRISDFNSQRQNRNGEIAFRTGQMKTIIWRNPQTNSTNSQRGMIYKDLDTGEEYIRIDCMVTPKEIKEFYALASDPYHIVRMSDNQRITELARQKYGKSNWIDQPQKEVDFVIEYNNRPIKFGGRNPIIHIKRG